MNEHRQLKKIYREIRFRNHIGSDLTHNQYNMAILSFMSVCILGRLQNKQSKLNISSIEFLNEYREEVNLLSSRFPFFRRKVNYIENITNDTLNQVINYINELETSMDNVLAWSYQITPSNTSSTTHSKGLRNYSQRKFIMK